MPSVVFHPLAADASDYPKPAIPALAPFSATGWQRRQSASPDSAFFDDDGESFIQGRYALAEAMRRAGAQAGKRVLLPSFHCRAVVEPAIYLGAEPCFYPLTSELRPNFAALARLLQTGERPVAMVLTHYFGFPNAAEEAEQFCKQHGIVMIEDCAHALYGQVGGRQLGRVGSYSAASLWKFLPVPDGAVLLDNTGARPHIICKQKQPTKAEIKALVRTMETSARRAFASDRLPSLDAKALVAGAQQIAARRVERVVAMGMKEFSPPFAESTALSFSQWLAPRIAHERVARKRRENYQRWLAGMEYSTVVKPLFPELPDHVVPYAFPLVADAEGLIFHALKLAGVPMWRWEDMAVTDCPVANHYRLRLLQLPCHQELSVKELDWMIRTLRLLSEELYR